MRARATHPYLPFVTEEIYHTLRTRKPGHDLVVEQLPLYVAPDKITLQEGAFLQELGEGGPELRGMVWGLVPRAVASSEQRVAGSEEKGGGNRRLQRKPRASGYPLLATRYPPARYSLPATRCFLGNHGTNMLVLAAYSA